jgi:hypothetical protein
MKKAHRWPAAALTSAVLLGASALYAQQAPVAPGSDPEVSVPMGKEAQVPAAAMQSRARDLTAQVNSDKGRVDQLRAEARKQKDILKLNCINDKLAQIRQLQGILGEAADRLAVAIATSDEAERYHRYTIITISAEKVRTLRGEAEACIGEAVAYLGPLDLGVDEPAIPDDPTVDDPLDGDDVIEPPGYASPFE